jgi:hypothetical protein
LCIIVRRWRKSVGWYKTICKYQYYSYLKNKERLGT